MPVHRICSVLILLVTSFALQAATFYVSPSGDDASDGKSEQKPWKTVAKVSAAAFQPGDQILFARGGEWRECLSASSSGAPGKPIVYDAYGKGAKPKFWGSDALDSKNWRAEAANIYAYAGLKAARVTQVLANHGTEAKGEWFGPLTGKPLAESPGKLEFKDGTLRIHSTSDPRSDGRVYTAVTRQDVVHSNGKNHLVFKNLQGDETSDPDMGYVMRVMDSADVVMEDCDAFRGGKHLFGVINSTGFVGRRLYAAHAQPHNQKQGCTFYVSYTGHESKHSNATSEYIDCTGEHFEDGDGGAYMYFVCHGEKQGPITFINPAVLGGKFSFLQDSKEQKVTVKGGLIQDSNLELITSNALIDGVKFLGNSCIDIWGNENTIQNCLMLISPKGGGPTGFGTAILTRKGNDGKGGQRNVIRFNTVVIDPTSPNDKTCLAIGGSGQKTQWYANIFISNGTAINFWGGDPVSADAENSDFNFYNKDARFAFGKLSFDQWKALGFADKNSLSGEPPFITKDNYMLHPTFRAKNAAKLDPAILKQVPFDFSGKPRGQAGAVNIGAFE